MDIRQYNREAWNREVAQGNQWTIPASEKIIQDAKEGKWDIVLTPTIPVPKDWFPELKETPVLCLASGGGQQAPVLAAAGADVTVLDNSPKQLEQDKYVAEREGLSIRTVEGDMADLSMFPDGNFQLIVHPVSNLFAPDIMPVWREAFRVLKHGGVLLSGFDNPVIHMVDYETHERTGIFQVVYKLPYSDLTSLPEDIRDKYIKNGEPLEFGHTLEQQIGRQLKAGFIITGLFEDSFITTEDNPLAEYTALFIATRAVKP